MKESDLVRSTQTYKWIEDWNGRTHSTLAQQYSVSRWRVVDEWLNGLLRSSHTYPWLQEQIKLQI